MIGTARDKREKRRLRIRKKIVGTAERPRLSLFKSLKHLYVQLTDDTAGRTLASATTNTKANKAGGKKSFANVSGAQTLGKEIADKAKSAGVDSIVFDRSGYPYHGVIKAVAEAAREAGLKF
jgi:large subunit ribosomal protein L18